MKRDAFLKINLFLFAICISGISQAEEIRDPFVSLGDKLEITQKKEEVIQLPFPVVLKGTMFTKNNFVAVVNDDIIKQGEKWKDFYVAKIEPGKVVLEWKNKKFEIGLSPKKQEEQKGE